MSIKLTSRALALRHTLSMIFFFLPLIRYLLKIIQNKSGVTPKIRFHILKLFSSCLVLISALDIKFGCGLCFN